MSANQKLIFRLAALVAVVFLIYVWLSRPAEAPKDDSANVEEAQVMSEKPAEGEAQAEPAKKIVAPSGYRVGQFPQVLRELNKCFGFPGSMDADNGGGTVENLLGVLRYEMGEPVVRTEDWNNTEIVTPSGEKRRIRVEMDYGNEEKVVRRLKYSTVDDSGKVTPIPMPDDQTEDPSDTLLASLEQDGKVVYREKASRVYFQSGEELTYSDRDGLIWAIEILRNGKTFKCNEILSDKISCHCY